ncbi:MAG TPA: TetR family transcriptional regulator [Dehalococcoidia bacterium]|jgi:AcrR family transcriptional regulator|nr:TetR family transcriptional regulator [Dehalococcoidia bacterium]
MPKVTEAYLEARRAEILDAAWRCLARKGYHQTTMQDVCEESGLSYGAIYRYFASKEEILHAIFERIAEVSNAIVEQAHTQTADPRNALEAIGRVTFSYFDQPNFEFVTRTDIEIWPEMMRNDVLRERFREGVLYWHEVVSGLLSEAQRRGKLRPDVEPKAVAALDMCAFEGLRRYRLIAPEIFEPEPIRQLLDTLGREGGADDGNPD